MGGDPDIATNFEAHRSQDSHPGITTAATVGCHAEASGLVNAAERRGAAMLSQQFTGGAIALAGTPAMVVAAGAVTSGWWCPGIP